MNGEERHFITSKNVIQGGDGGYITCCSADSCKILDISLFKWKALQYLMTEDERVPCFIKWWGGSICLFWMFCANISPPLIWRYNSQQITGHDFCATFSKFIEITDKNNINVTLLSMGWCCHWSQCHFTCHW